MKDGMERINQLFDEYDFPLNAMQTVRVRLRRLVHRWWQAN